LVEEEGDETRKVRAGIKERGVGRYGNLEEGAITVVKRKGSSKKKQKFPTVTDPKRRVH